MLLKTLFFLMIQMNHLANLTQEPSVWIMEWIGWTQIVTLLKFLEWFTDWMSLIQTAN